MSESILQPDYIKHVCTPYVACRCYVGGDAPDDDCPIHAGGVADRCECGRFVSIKPAPPKDTDGGGA